MKGEDEFHTQKLQLEKSALRRARVTSIVLGIAAIVAVLFMIYGFTQSIEATRQRDIAVTNKKALILATEEIKNLKEQLVGVIGRRSHFGFVLRNKFRWKASATMRDGKENWDIRIFGRCDSENVGHNCFVARLFSFGLALD